MTTNIWISAKVFLNLVFRLKGIWTQLKSFLTDFSVFFSKLALS